ncbi:MAG: helix-turn-helix domain-containing protein [Terriglobales bacterium]
MPLPALTLDTREVLRCPQCQLVQFRTQNGFCRRCRGALDAAPPPPPPPVLAAKVAELEPGVETAEASGVLVPDVAGAIRLWRQGRGLSQRQLAERMRVPRTYVSKIENDKATPTLTSLERMAAAMETSVARLLDGVPASSGAGVLDDAFVRALLPYIARLGPQDRARLLQASERLAQHSCSEVLAPY